ncbi:hypothetical protein CQ054_22630 [Ochrobactrum sp. MYb29]|nr:hypothetical protein CQ054_22630 [Ochrobactrum sp. MYb29]
MTINPNPNEQYVRRGELCRMLSISYPTLARRIKDGSIVDGVQFGQLEIKRWPLSYVEALITNK